MIRAIKRQARMLLSLLGLAGKRFTPGYQPYVMAWILRCLCCNCLRKNKSDKAELLSVAKEDDATSKQNYTVRRISSFGGNDSREDIDDSYSELPDVGELCGSSPADTWTRTVHKIQPDSGSMDAITGRQRGRWQKALHTLRPKRGKSKEPPKKDLPPITVSSPDIVRDVERELTSTKPNGDGPPLCHPGIVSNVSSVTVVAQQARWLKCQSMQVRDENRRSRTGRHRGRVTPVKSQDPTNSKGTTSDNRNSNNDTHASDHNSPQDRRRSGDRINGYHNPADHLNINDCKCASGNRECNDFISSNGCTSPKAYKIPNDVHSLNNQSGHNGHRISLDCRSSIDHSNYDGRGSNDRRSPNYHSAQGSPRDCRDSQDPKSPIPLRSSLRPTGGVLNSESGRTSPVAVVNHTKLRVHWYNPQDINSAESGPVVEEIEDRKETNSTLLARSYGLDTSLYSPVSPQGSGTMSRSTEALYAWRTSDSMGGCLQELACGAVHFSANYYHRNKKFFVHINKLEELPPKGNDKEYEIIIKLTMLPSNKQSKMSRVLRGSLSPEVEEDFHFSVKEPAGKVLRLSVFNADLQGKYDAIGHALFYLEDVLAGRPRRYIMKLYKQSQPDIVPGSIELSLRYDSQEQKLSIMVMQARNLMALQVGKNSRLTDKYNTYAKVSLYFAGQKIKSKKSPVVPNTRNPLFNHSYRFLLATASLENSYVVITVMLKGTLKKNLPIGHLVLGPNFYAEGSTLTPWGRAILDEDIVSHWFRMYL